MSVLGREDWWNNLHEKHLAEYQPKEYAQPEPYLLSEHELKADDMILELLQHIRDNIVGKGKSRDSHMRDVVFHIHGLQTIVMSQAAARAYPQRFRLLGE